MNDYKRNIVIKLWISNIINSEYKKDNENNASFITLTDGRIVSRVNIVGTIINIYQEETTYFTIDDGTGEIKIIPFNDLEKIKNLNIGEIVLIIGRVREFGDVYITPEIIKKINDKKWIELRKLELEYKISEKISKEEIFNIINSLDNGDGADYQTLLSKLGDNAEDKIKILFDSGEIFETRPGKIKILN